MTKIIQKSTDLCTVHGDMSMEFSATAELALMESSVESEAASPNH
jgi:hypothetical protein